jgi:hypothetical protein
VQTELLIVVIAKSLVELAGLFIFGQGVLYLLAGKNRERNLFYQIFQIVTRPLYKAIRFVTPRVVIDRHIPYLTLIVLGWIWLGLTFWLLPSMCASGKYDCTPLIERKKQQSFAPGALQIALCPTEGEFRLSV